MIIFDTPRKTTFRRFKRTAHCASTLIGEEGTAELIAFGRRIGLREEWLQHRGEPREHFDLFDTKILRAMGEGAEQVKGSEFVKRVLWPKREAL